jgi:hypothetical protein
VQDVPELSQQRERRDPPNGPASENDAHSKSTPSTTSLADLYAELESFSGLHGGSRGDFNEMNFSSDGPASWSALGLNTPVEFILQSGLGNEEENFFLP